jgi:hypothetical protein
MYTIDLVTLLQLLGEFHRSGILRTELLPGLPGLNRRCYVVVELRNGVMASCAVKDVQNSFLLTDQKAFQVISAAGNLNWEFEESSTQMPDESFRQQSPSGPLSTPPITAPLRSITDPLPRVPSAPLKPPTTTPLPGQAPFFYAPPTPRQRFSVSNADINRWPRKYRQVYMLIDGERDVEKIAAMLSLSPQAVEDVLRDLQSNGVIVLE